jgi:hypothetical protein
MAKNKRTMKGRNRNGSRLQRSLDIVPYLKVPNPSTHRFHRDIDVGSIVASAADQGIGRFFTFNQLPNYTDFTNLFNSYRIRQVDLTYVLTTPTLTLGKAYPRLAFCVDYNDATNPGSQTDVTQYENAEVYQFGPNRTVFKRTVQPRIAVGAYAGAFSAFSMPPSDTWVNADYAAVQYYGIKEWVTNYNTVLASGAVIELYYRMHFEVRTLR